MNYGLPQTEIAKPCLLQLFFSLTVQGGAVPPKAAPGPYRLRNALRKNSVLRQLSEEIHGSGYPAGYAPIKCIQ